VSNTVRFWRNSNTVVIGRFQCKEAEVNLEAAKRHGTTVARRFTGGGAVYHDSGNLNYAVSVDRNHPLFPKDIVEIYRPFSTSIIRGLNILGLNAQFRPPNTIQIDGKKISGIAACLNWGVVFCHGTLLVDSNLHILSELLNAPQYAKSMVPSVRTQVTALQKELGKELSMTKVKEALKRGFEEMYGVILLDGKLTGDEEELAEQLYEKYAKDEWDSER
jgi:lipoate-protein ligase A